MARIRTIKPDFWTDEKLTECSVTARLLFIATWNFADDQGNLDRSPKQLKARAFPIDNIDCEPLLQELMAQGVLIEYSVNDKKYLHIQKFKDHQVINRPSKPSCPLYEESLRTHGVIAEPSLPKEGRKEGSRAKKTELQINEIVELGVTATLAKDFLALRTKKRAPLTQTAMDGIVRESQKAGVSLTEALETCCKRGWQGFEADWFQKINNPTAKDDPYGIKGAI
jgi:hypothetical protein